MIRPMRLFPTALLLLTLVLSGCAQVSTVVTHDDIPATAKVLTGGIYYQDLIVSGEVVIKEPLYFTKRATLTLRPGTTVYFDWRGEALEAGAKPGITALGAVDADAAGGEPVRFIEAGSGATLIHVSGGKEAVFRNCIFQGGSLALNVEGSKVRISDSRFSGAESAFVAIKSEVEVQGTLFTGNGEAVRVAGSAAPVFKGNEFVDNGVGLLLAGGVDVPLIKGNYFANTGIDLGLQNGQTGQVDAGGNWWKAAEEGRLEKAILDSADFEELGTVEPDPVLPMSERGK